MSEPETKPDAPDDEFALAIAGRIEADEALAGDNWDLAEYAIGELYGLKAAEEAIKTRAKDHMTYLLSEVKGRRAGLLWRCKNDIRARVDADLVGKKRKSITYATGKAGYRNTAASEKLVLDDEAKAIMWAETACPEAIRQSINMTVLKSTAITQGCPDGCHYEKTSAQESFFIGPEVVDRKQLTADAPTETKRESARDFLSKGVAEVDFDS